MAQSDKAKKNFEEIKKSTKETMDFIKEMSKDFPDVVNYAKRLASTFSDAKKLSGDQLKVLKSTNDITREILGNRKNIHKESFNTVDLDKLSAQYAKQGLGNRKKILQILKHEQRIQKSINNQINASANAAKSFGESISSGVQNIPFVGKFLSTAMGLDNLGQDIADSLRKGFSGNQAKLFGGATGEALGSGIIDSFRGKELRPSDLMNLKNFQDEFNAGMYPGRTQMEAWGDFKDKLYADKGNPVEQMQNALKKGGTRDIRMALKRLVWDTPTEAVTEMFRKIGAGPFGKMVGGGLVAGIGILFTKKMTQGFQALTGDNFLKSFLPGFEAFRNNFGDVSRFSTDAAWDAFMMRVNFGVSADSAFKLAKTMESISGMSVEQSLATQKDIAYQARRANVLPDDVIKDMADNSNLIAEFTNDGGKNMARAVIEARKLGLSIDTTAKIANTLLDFESSIESEMEASLLIGRQLNLNRARELALTGDMAKLQAEIVKQVGSEEALQRLNVVQRRAFAAALGISVEELNKLTQGGGIQIQSKALTAISSFLKKFGPWIAGGLGAWFIYEYAKIAFAQVAATKGNTSSNIINTNALNMNTRAQLYGAGLPGGGSAPLLLGSGKGKNLPVPTPKGMGGRLGTMGRGLGRFALPVAGMMGVYDLGAGIATGNQQKMISGGGTLGGMAVGAAIGSVVPGVGTAVGAGIGGLVGWLGSMVVNSARSSDSSSSAIVDQLVMMRREQKQGFSDLAGNV